MFDLCSIKSENIWPLKPFPPPNAVSHFSTRNEKACTDPGYKWKVWYDRCSNHYYLQNTYFGDWLDASDAGLVKHSKCNINAYGTSDSCGDWRRWRFDDLTIKYDSQ